jgi:hypothetical protein
MNEVKMPNSTMMHAKIAVDETQAILSVRTSVQPEFRELNDG